ncbi:uncharacterized protein TA11980 [Theileria annulata]|uniref:Uncharacterized protein n=1 Tax=Theileria annulata TaxID=5874 RepID=Q4UD95_THEAN|nr:uncharacterized protein TA11980 [Theileria annulata]CAI74944.1 hypothetical protein, conserved [Theileria annulata]|eukprot:XP_952676.1 hypothetical protein, conserved [Theileria annulata]
MDDVEINLKLASLGCLNDSVAGEDYIADYILYRLNKLHLYTYVKTLNLSSPTNNISQISQHIGEIIVKKWNSVDPVNCYKIFINQFRMGFFGKICLDDLSNVIQLNQLNDYTLSYPDNINLILLISNSTTR